MLYDGIAQNDLKDNDIDSCSDVNKIMRVYHRFLFPPRTGPLHCLELESLTDIAKKLRNVPTAQPLNTFQHNSKEC